MPVITIVLIVFALLALMLLLTALSAWRDRRRLRAGSRAVLAALFTSLALLCAAIMLGTRGYRALTREVVAATIRTEPLAPHRFRATVTLADGSLKIFDLAGDAVYVDAHVLKWRPLVNVLGLHTAYELDRIAGRYQRLTDEQASARTVYSLATAKPFNTFDMARRYWLFRPLVDAEYGSATFIGATHPATYEVRVSTTGLLIRPVESR